MIHRDGASQPVLTQKVPMTDSVLHDRDPVAASVAAYTPHAAGYARAHADAVASQRQRFLAALPVGGRVLDAG